MTIKIIKNYIVLLVIFFSWVNLVHANLEITEIMYAPEGGANYEWVEVYNNGSTSLDLNKYRFFHGETTSGPITLKSGDTTILQPSKYAIIAKSLTDYSWLNFSDMVFSASTLSLPDSGDNTYIAISDAEKNIIDEVTYDTSKGGSKESKSSLSKIDGSWQNGIPTPGAENVLSSEEETNNENLTETTNTTDNTEDTTSSSSSSKKDVSKILKITTKIILPKIITAGIPFLINSLTTSNRGETYAVGKFIWNFGDGMISEVNKSTIFDYMYEYPGEYVLTLSYFDSHFSEVADATDRIIVKVIPSEIYISGVGSGTDPYIELENKSNYEIALSSWIVTGGIHYFTIPLGTTLLPNKKIKLSPKITGFTSNDIKSVVITDPNKEIIATYPVEIKKPIPKVSLVKTVNSLVPSESNLQEDSSSKDPQVINLNDLGASVEDGSVSIPNSAYPVIGLLVVIGLGITSFLFIKKKNNNNTDYVEKEIRAEDMTIVE